MGLRWIVTDHLGWKRPSGSPRSTNNLTYWVPSLNCAYECHKTMILVQWLPPTPKVYCKKSSSSLKNQSQQTLLVITGPVITWPRCALICSSHLLSFAFILFACVCVCNSLRQLLCLENLHVRKSKNSMSLVPINFIFHHSHVLWTDPWFVFGNIYLLYSQKSLIWLSAVLWLCMPCSGQIQ